MTEGIIWRTTEREVTRSVAESRGWARMDEKKQLHDSGGYALRGDTRSHPEHDG